MPPALLFAALGLALAFAPRRVLAASLASLGVTMIAFAFAPFPRSCLESVFLACWISVAVTAAAVHWPGGPGTWSALALSVNAGIWTSGVVALAGSRPDLLRALPAVLIVLPAAWLVARRASIAVKVMSSWLIAIAALAATLQFLSVTPGYLPDHLE